MKIYTHRKEILDTFTIDDYCDSCIYILRTMDLDYYKLVKVNELYCFINLESTSGNYVIASTSLSKLFKDALRSIRGYLQGYSHDIFCFETYKEYHKWIGKELKYEETITK